MAIEIKVEGVIVSVEKGSIHTKPNDPVIAFTVATEKAPVKAIVKGNQAKLLWNHFLKDSGTASSVKSTEYGNVSKQVFIKFTGYLKDYRKEGIVVENIEDVQFNYIFTLG